MIFALWTNSSKVRSYWHISGNLRTSRRTKNKKAESQHQLLPYKKKVQTKLQLDIWQTLLLNKKWKKVKKGTQLYCIRKSITFIFNFIRQTKMLPSNWSNDLQVTLWTSNIKLANIFIGNSMNVIFERYKQWEK